MFPCKKLMACASLLLSACGSEDGGGGDCAADFSRLAAGEEAVYRLDEGGALIYIEIKVTRATEREVTFEAITHAGSPFAPGVTTVYDINKPEACAFNVGVNGNDRVRVALGLASNWGGFPADPSTSGFGGQQQLSCADAQRATPAGTFAVRRCNIQDTKNGATAIYVDDTARGSSPGNGFVARVVREGQPDEWTAVLESWNGR